MTFLDFPFHASGGRTARALLPEHARDLIEQVLFTEPGERVNRPEFGCGLARFVFEPTDDERLTALRFLVQGELQRWLGGLIEIGRVAVEAPANEPGTLRVTVEYVVRATGRFGRDAFVRRTVA